MHLILASASPRRAELLRAAGFTFDVAVVEIDERVCPGEAPDEYVRRLASEKSRAAASSPRTAGAGQAPLVVLAADTAVVVDGEILGKPRDDDDARAMLRRLSGRWHDVLTGMSVRSGVAEVSRVDRTRVEFAPVSEGDLAWYVSTGEGRDKAGAYAIQGLASRFVLRIEGSYSNVVGLPIATVVELLAEIGQDPHLGWRDPLETIGEK